MDTRGGDSVIVRRYSTPSRTRPSSTLRIGMYVSVRASKNQSSSRNSGYSG